MGNILRYFLDKYGRLYDKKARFLSEPSLHGRTECCQGNMRIHSASIAVCKPPPRYYTPGVGLPLHPSTSALVMPRFRCPPAPLAVAISLIRQPHEVTASGSRLSAPSG